MALPFRILAGLCDAAVAPAFAAPGYWLRSKTWDPAALDVDLRGRRIVLTGGNAGLGRATAEALAARGATLELVCRSRERGEAARAELAAAHPQAHIHLHLCDIAELAQVGRLADALEGPVDVLIHNAGVLLDEREETGEGVERSFATNVLGPQALTRRLRPKLREGSRVIWVSSGGMYSQRLQLAELQAREPFDGVVAYAQNKRAQVILSEMWAEELAGEGVTVNAMHPGWADTPGIQRSLPRFRALLRPLLRDWEQGADTIVWLAISPEAAGQTGRFWFDRMPRRTHAPLAATRATEADRKALWEECERLCDAHLPESGVNG